MMAFTRRIPLSDPTCRHLQGCRDEMTDLFLRKFRCEVELRGPKAGGYSAPSIKPGEKVYEKRMLRGPVVSVWKGDLTKQDADVVVNAANNDLDHAGGLARALAEAGGPIVVKESKDYIRANGPLKTGEFAVTRAGDLPCKWLLHAVGPVWFDNAAAQCEDELAKCIENVLTYATQNKAVQSVAIPAISSGIFGFPLQKCAEIIARSVRSFFTRSVTSTHLREIRLVNNDDPTVQAMKRACENVFWQSEALSGATSASGSQTGAVTRSRAAALQPSSSAASNTNVYGQPTAQQIPRPVTINGLTLHLVKGLIEEQKTAIIVNSVSCTLDLNSGEISKAILLKAGSGMQNEIQKKKSHKLKPKMIPTKGFNLSCGYVYHVILPTTPNEHALQVLAQATQECLQVAHDHKSGSISFPALGTGNLKLPKQKVAKVMTEAVLEFARKVRSRLDVYFVIYPKDSDTYEAFQHQFNLHRTNPDVSSEQRDPRPEVRGESSGSPGAEIPCLIIRGTREEHVEEAKVWMTNVLHPQPVSIQNNFVLLFGEEEHDVLTSVEASLEVKLSHGTSVVTIDGPPQDKVRAVIEVERLLLDVQEKHAVTLEEELLEAAVMWFYENKGGAYRYSAKANRELEKAYVSQRDLTLESDPRHVICMKTLTAQGKDGTLQLQRRTIADSSKNGQTRRRAGDPVLLVDPNSQEFKDQENRFKREKLTLVKMEKIHNSYLTQIFLSKKGAKPSEKKTSRVYQLVPRAFTELVCDVGFQRIFSNPKDARLGQGIYFTDTPRRALECFQTPEEEGGLYHIFQAEVLSDSPAVIRDAPAFVPKKSPRGSNPDDILDLCDSLVNAHLSPTIYAIPDSFQANPLYLFTCQKQGVDSARK